MLTWWEKLLLLFMCKICPVLESSIHRKVPYYICTLVSLLWMALCPPLSSSGSSIAHHLFKVKYGSEQTGLLWQDVESTAPAQSQEASTSTVTDRCSHLLDSPSLMFPSFASAVTLSSQLHINFVHADILQTNSVVCPNHASFLW